MQTGLDRLLGFQRRALKGKSLGLLAHPASLDKSLQPVWNILAQEFPGQLKVIFGPEHGFQGQAQDMEAVEDSTTQHFGNIPTFSLYGQKIESLKPQEAWLQEIDTLIVDLQDVGARYYTFIYTLAFCMEVAAKTQTKVLVLDRPNPINGHLVEGNLVDEKFLSFVGQFPLANRHGMTIGELAYLFKDQFNIPCDLQVIPMKGWHRRRYMDELDLPWILPSPNMPTVETAVVYPGMCLLEGTELSEGRGTTRPFEIFGAPFIDPETLVNRLKEFRLPGVRFRPMFFKPMFQKHAAILCGGAQIHVTRRRVFQPFLTGVAVLKAIFELYPKQFSWRHRAYEFVENIPAIDLLAGNDQLRFQIKKGTSLKKISETWQEDREKFLADRKKYLIYT